MPIYAYRCESCGFGKDVLQKMSDAPLTQCPECGKDAFRKQVTAAGFQLKGSGWYVTDFRGGSGGASAAAKPAAGEGGAAEPAKADGGKSDAGSSPAGADSAKAAPAAPAAAAPASSAGADGA